MKWCDKGILVINLFQGELKILYRVIIAHIKKKQMFTYNEWKGVKKKKKKTTKLCHQSAEMHKYLCSIFRLLKNT